MTTPLSRRASFTTADPAAARDFFDRTYGGRLEVVASADTDWRVVWSHVDAGQFGVDQLRLPADLTFDLTGRDEFAVDTLLSGCVQNGRGRDEDRFAAGDVYFGSAPRSQTVVRTHQARLHAVVLPRALVLDVAGAFAERGSSCEFLSGRASGDGVARWRRTTRLVDGLLADPASVTGVAVSQLLLGPAARLLAATALAVFPNTAVTEPTIEDRHDAHPDALRRAVAYIDSFPDRDISVADIARAACVTPRAVQLAFRRHLDTTPLAYLRRVRLEQAHRQLWEAAPGNGTTVTGVASSWGFTASRFARHYRSVYGVAPHDTLRA